MLLSFHKIQQRRDSNKTVEEVRELYSGEVLIWSKGRGIQLRELEGRKASEITETQKMDSGEKEQYRPPVRPLWRRGWKRNSYAAMGVGEIIPN
jgi:hypothetical protein